tara:strand:- start:7783 stop:8571 length:789 start_codon:yes stop_codon:yes gene_type:complete
MKKIESLHNSFIKNIIKLQEKSRERKKQGLFVIEGKREVTLALKGNYTIKSLLFVSKIVPQEYIDLFTEINLIEISEEVYQKIAYRESTEGIIALSVVRNTKIDSISLKKINPLILIIEGIEKPGNIGAMLRTADAANIDAVILADSKTDIFNPNVIRSSLGCIFTNQIIIASSQDIIRFLEKNNINSYATTLQNSNSYIKENYKGSSAIIMGTESTGLKDIWRTNATKNINIPMQGEIDSMNVSVAAAIILFEAKRQRKFK